MEKTTRDKILAFQNGSEKAFEELMVQFEPLVNKYTRYFGTYEILKNISPSFYKMKGDGEMEQTLLEAATAQGIWVLLFIALFLYTIKNHEKMLEKQEQREEKYQNLLLEMTEKFVVLENIQNSIEEIKKQLLEVT